MRRPFLLQPPNVCSCISLEYFLVPRKYRLQGRLLCACGRSISPPPHTHVRVGWEVCRKFLLEFERWSFRFVQLVCHQGAFLRSNIFTNCPKTTIFPRLRRSRGISEGSPFLRGRPPPWHNGKSDPEPTFPKYRMLSQF